MTAFFETPAAAQIERRPGGCRRGHAVDHAHFVVNEIVPMDDNAGYCISDTDQFRGQCRVDPFGSV
jgi:hypothetical protein